MMWLIDVFLIVWKSTEKYLLVCFGLLMGFDDNTKNLEYHKIWHKLGASDDLGLGNLMSSMAFCRIFCSSCL